MEYAENYERCCLEETNVLQRWFMAILTRKAKTIGQDSHKIWSLKFVMDRYFEIRQGLRVMDCGAWNGWFLSYRIDAISQRIALDFDSHYAPQLRKDGIDFILADLEKGSLPVASNSLDLVAMTSTLEHLTHVDHVAKEIRRVLKPGGITFITVPDIMKYKFHFWDDVTHKRPFNASSLRHLFETHGLATEELCPYNHNLFIAANLFPPAFHMALTRFRGKALMYIGRKPHA